MPTSVEELYRGSKNFFTLKPTFTSLPTRGQAVRRRQCAEVDISNSPTEMKGKKRLSAYGVFVSSLMNLPALRHELPAYELRHGPVVLMPYVNRARRA